MQMFLCSFWKLTKMTANAKTHKEKSSDEMTEEDRRRHQKSIFWKLETEGHGITDSAEQRKMTCMSTGRRSMTIPATGIPRSSGLRDQVSFKAGIRGGAKIKGLVESISKAQGDP